MNEAGDYEVAKDEDSVVDLWNENVGRPFAAPGQTQGHNGGARYNRG
jgi:hypothetical protein